MRAHRIAVSLVALAAVVAVVICTVSAGPPLICHHVEIGEAESLPLGRGDYTPKFGYGADDAIPDAMAILVTSDSAIVHMETLRRATIYAQKDRGGLDRLMSRVLARALDATTEEAGAALAWFDAGYLTQCYRQIDRKRGPDVGTEDGIAGYRWVRRAVELRPEDAEIALGAAMVTACRDVDRHQEHVRRAVELSESESLVRTNLALQQSNWDHHSPRPERPTLH